MQNVYDVLKARGYVEQATHEEELREMLGKESVTFYIGFDPTADSLHIGHFIQIMVMMHMQQHGHKPIALVGAGTVKVGDPSGKTEMRQMLFYDQINANAVKIKEQLQRYLKIDEVNGFMANNADWLDNLNYIDFLREIGSKFSVNRMLAAECFKSRLERGLSFLEFNYMIMQGYDFLELYRRYNCKLQLGGNDQWSNILAGAELVRKADQGDAYGLTFKLLTTSDGKKMGKTEAGAIWIDPEKTSPYELFQYFRNVGDADVVNCMKLLTFLPLVEIEALGNLEGSEINRAKEKLAYEITKIIHGEEEADKALASAHALFSDAGELTEMPTTTLSAEALNAGMTILDLLQLAGLIESKGEGRRLITQKGVTINGGVVEAHDRLISEGDFKDGVLMLRKGKKIFHRVTKD
jgi:tyrosyl-tRNA synthetase